MEYVILGLLLIESMTLYSLNKAFEQGISMFYSPSMGSIQSAVKRLTQKKLITTEESVVNGRLKKVISINAEGKSVFFEWMKSPLDTSNLEVSFLSKLYFIGLVPTNKGKFDLLTTMLDAIKASKNTLDATHIELDKIQVPTTYADIFHYQKKVLSYGIDTHAFAIHWIEQLLLEIENKTKEKP